MSSEFDLLVIGAGPAGLAAAYRAASNGLKTGIVDDNPDTGGQIWRRGIDTSMAPEARTWFERIQSVDLQFISGARIFQQRNANTLLAESPAGIRELSYDKLVLATGARERFLPFPGWTLPNVLGAGGLQALVKTGLPIDGKRVVVAGSGPLLLAVATYLREHGADLALIAEQAPPSRLAKFGFSLLQQGAKRSQALDLRRRLRGVKYLASCWPVAAQGVDKLTSVTFERDGKRWEVACDYLACGFHLVPNLELPELLGCEIEQGAALVEEFQQTSVARVYAAGETTGIGGLELSLVEGEIAGLAAAGQHDTARHLFALRARQRKFARVLEETFALRDELKHLAAGDTVVCRCEDVTYERLRARDSWRAAKLQTRCGMGPCQGRVCGAAVEFLFGWRAESVRPPIFPVRVDSLLEPITNEAEAQ